MKVNIRIKRVVLLLSGIWIFMTVPSFAQYPKPVVIPEIQEWTGREGYCVPSGRILVSGESCEELIAVAETFIADLSSVSGIDFRLSRREHLRKGDILLSLSAVDRTVPEKYEIDISDRISVRGQSVQAVFWATRTLLQMIETGNDRLPSGIISDWPNYPRRGFMLDVARKYFPIEFLRDYVKILSYYKMNLFQLHLNDNGFKQHFGNSWENTPAFFRLESETFPGLATPGEHYTKQEFVELQKLAQEYHVDIVPEIDMPAHSLVFTRYLPELASDRYGPDHLDLFNDRTYAFGDALWKEYVSGPDPVFLGKEVHIGTDEYANENPEVVEQFRHFTDHYIRFVENFGKRAVVWGALTHASGNTVVSSDDVVMDIWYNGYADPHEMLEHGYGLMNVLCTHLYIVPLTELYYHDYLDTRWLYENWEPYMFDEQVFSPDDRRIKGGMFAIWNDNIGNGVTVKDIHSRAFPAVQTLSAKMWRGKCELPYDRFCDCARQLSDAPGVNVSGRLQTAGHDPAYQAHELFPESVLPLGEVGFDYTISFDFESTSDEKGTILFKSEHAIFYQSTPLNGKVGFCADGYLNEFDYEFPSCRQVRVTIKGTENRTELYVDGNLLQSLCKRPFKTVDGHCLKYQSSLVFPFSSTGAFQGKMKNVKVAQTSW